MNIAYDSRNGGEKEQGNVFGSKTYLTEIQPETDGLRTEINTITAIPTKFNNVVNNSIKL